MFDALSIIKKKIRKSLPFRIIIIIYVIKGRLIRYKIKFFKKQIPKNCYIDPSVQIIGFDNIIIGNNTTLSQNTWLNVNHRVLKEKKIIIGNNCHIGRNNFFSSGPVIVLKDYCFTGIDCRFIGCGHNIDSPLIPYLASGLTKGDSIEIGVNCWLTTAVTVMQGVVIGYGSIIGAGALVLDSIPPFSIAVGSPCKVIKRFNFNNNQWIEIDEWLDSWCKDYPSEEEYLELLKNKFNTITPALLSGSNRFGWI